ncbi:DUF2892 domain-containing protein [Candidatus Latescibacterota bacterium]
MKANVGGIDRIIRTVAGVVIIGLGIAYQSWWGIIGILPLISALTCWCPPYSLLGISTCRAPAGDISETEQQG